MKALKCIGCKSYVVVSDGTTGYCGKCSIELQPDRRLAEELKLTKDIPIKAYKQKKTKKQSKTKHKKSKKKKQ